MPTFINSAALVWETGRSPCRMIATLAAIMARWPSCRHH
jgi:hypothetical protein